MRIVRTETLLDKGSFSQSEDWRLIESQVLKCIRTLAWPKGSGKFILYDQSGKKRGEGNGVTPIKKGFVLCLQRRGWHVETQMDFATVKSPGPIDATYRVGDKYFALEWETGNVSSSHRSLNKMVLGMIRGVLIGGALIVPTRAMYNYLTDRIGNYEELAPYFDVWRNVKVNNGILVVIAVEHDGVSKDVPRIPKATDGRALV